MQLLPEGQKNAVKVTFEDQRKINQFSKLIMRKDAIEQELSAQRQEKEYFEDVSLEIELIDEEEFVQYKIGIIFLLLKQKEVVEQLEKDLQSTESRIEELETERDGLDTQLKELKTILYAKFGDNINLER